MLLFKIIIIGLILIINLIIGLLMLGSIIGHIMGSPFFPSSDKNVRKMIKLAELKDTDVVFDLGCGDGRIIFAAEKHCQKSIGIEGSFFVYLLALFRKFISNNKAEIRRQNIFDTKDLADANVIFVFLLPAMMEKFYQKIFPSLKNGTKIISNGFNIKSLKPTKTIPREKNEHPVYLFIK
ncbi:MAG: hypothetical protein N4A36_02415 [Candidatus Gracilibacteria bacterium]|nr:hypothetical protein [Candidatus Gracilibacteria bacterium]